MKKLLLTGLISLSVLLFGQKSYSKIRNSEINAEMQKVSENFLKEYIRKCQSKDYTEFKDYLIDKRIEKELYKKFPEACEKNGKIEILGFNAAYSNDNLKNADPVDVFIYDLKLENQSELKYGSIWVYKDKNMIGGVYFQEKNLFIKERNNFLS